MRIAFLHYGIFEGGDSNGWYRTFNLAKSLAGIGHDVTVFSTYGEKKLASDVTDPCDRLSIRVYGDIFPRRWRRGGFSFASALSKLRDLSKLPAFDVCIADNIHRPSCLIPAAYCKLIQKTPVVSEWWELFGRGGIYSDSGMVHKATVGLYDLAFERLVRKAICDGLCAISDYLREAAVSLGFSSGDICVLHAGADREIINAAKEIEKPSPSKVLRVGLIGANRNEILNNATALDACLELYDKGIAIEVICSGELDEHSFEAQKYSCILKILGWVSYEKFIEELSKCHVFLLYQTPSLRNIARFPNKFGDYVAMRGFILSNCVGDLKAYCDAEDSPLINLNHSSEILDFFLAIVSGELSYNHSDEFVSCNSWDARAQELGQFLERISSRKSGKRF